jgi:hypothetical protein
MKIAFFGPDGQAITVADTRRDSVLAKPGKDSSIALPQERRPSSSVIGYMKV